MVVVSHDVVEQERHSFGTDGVEEASMCREYEME